MIYLASRSPRRQQLLGQLDLVFSVLDVDIPEVRGANESALEYVSRVAKEKAEAGLSSLPDASDAWVIGADTEVVLDGDVFGKPQNAGEAMAMLDRLAGRTHQVITVVHCIGTQHADHVVSVSNVSFAAMTAAQIEAYVSTGEPFGKAGAYAIQGRGAVHISHLEGSYSGVMGLPLHETSRLLLRIGV